MPAFEAAGAKLYVLSYDEVDALADFKNAHGTTFAMLSDPDSEIIREFGILTPRLQRTITLGTAFRTRGCM